MCYGAGKTYIPVLGAPWKTIRGGLCHAIKAKMKIRTHPALTESVTSGLRPPTDGSIMAEREKSRNECRAWKSDAVARAKRAFL